MMSAWRSGDRPGKSFGFRGGRLWPEITRSSGCRRMATMSGSSQEPVDRGGLLGKRGTRRPEPTGAPRRSDRRPRAAGTRWVAGWRPWGEQRAGRAAAAPPTSHRADSRPGPNFGGPVAAQANPERGPPCGRGTAQSSLVLLDLGGKDHGAQRSGPCALETKFLRFETRQEQDSVLSLSPSRGFFRPGVLAAWPSFPRWRCRGSVCCRPPPFGNRTC